MSEKNELEAVRKLHEKDMVASKKGDYQTLRSIMSDDAVVLPPGGKAVRGKDVLDSNFAKMKESMQAVEVLEYVLDFEEVQIIGDYAFEWGTIRGSMRMKNSGDIIHSRYKVMRILRKENDEWKVFRTIWNDEHAEK
ncbi:nuclear transport factor 2 family protein [bacterium]|nr:nuclear transport factor 2 family protein [bacterium]